MVYSYIHKRAKLLIIHPPPPPPPPPKKKTHNAVHAVEVVPHVGINAAPGKVGIDQDPTEAVLKYTKVSYSMDNRAQGTGLETRVQPYS